MKTVSERWRDFEAQIRLTRASEVQRREMRRSFYAGFYSALLAGLEMAEESGDDDAKGVQLTEALHVECRRFAADVASGHA
jgi:hypothetical protein